jgi:hypothetical protein
MYISLLSRFLDKRCINHFTADLTELGEAVAAPRKSLKMSQNDVASRSGVSRESLAGMLGIITSIRSIDTSVELVFVGAYILIRASYEVIELCL